MYNGFYINLRRNALKGTVLYDVKDNVAVLTVDNPPVNPLSDGVELACMNVSQKLKKMILLKVL